MNCHVCGSEMSNQITDFPFKLSSNSIVIVKSLPVLQCDNCREYLIEDSVMEKIEDIFDKVDETVELEVVRFAA